MHVPEAIPVSRPRRDKTEEIRAFFLSASFEAAIWSTSARTALRASRACAPLSLMGCTSVAEGACVGCENNDGASETQRRRSHIHLSLAPPNTPQFHPSASSMTPRPPHASGYSLPHASSAAHMGSADGSVRGPPEPSQACPGTP